MRNIKKLLFTLAVIISLSTLLMGCCDESASIKVRKDGSVSVSLKATIGPSDINLIKGIEPKAKITSEGNVVSPLFETTANSFENNGFSVKGINNELETGFSATKEYIGIKDFNRDIEKLNKLGIINSNLKLYTKKTLFKNKYMIKGYIRYVKDKDLEKILERIKEKKLDNIDLSNKNLNLKISLYGNVDFSNADSGGWNANYNDKNSEQIKYSSYVYNEKSIMTATILSVISLIIIAFIIYRFIRR